MSKPKRKPVAPPPKRRRTPWPLIIAGAAAVSVLIAIAVAAEPDAVSNPGTRDPALVAEGATIFAANCAVCHGADLRGTAMVDVNMHAADVAGLRRE